MTKFVEVIDPYAKHKKRTRKNTNQKTVFNCRKVLIGDEPYCDYTAKEWKDMMEYYYENIRPSKSH